MDQEERSVVGKIASQVGGREYQETSCTVRRRLAADSDDIPVPITIGAFHSYKYRSEPTTPSYMDDAVPFHRRATKTHGA